MYSSLLVLVDASRRSHLCQRENLDSTLLCVRIRQQVSLNWYEILTSLTLSFSFGVINSRLVCTCFSPASTAVSSSKSVSRGGVAILSRLSRKSKS